MSTNKKDQNTKLVQAYHSMLKHFKESVQEVSHETGSIFHTALEMAKDRTALLEELTEEEAEQVAAYLKRDIEEAADFLLHVENNFKDALSLDKKYIEQSLLDWFAQVADKTKVDMETFNWSLKEYKREYKVGEVSGFGTLVCSKCGREEAFYEVKTIAPCVCCGCGEFKRKF